MKSVHRLTVDAYAAQHPGQSERRTVQSIWVHLVGLQLTLPWRGRGLMSEAVEAATDFWFGTLRFQELHTLKASENKGSVRISEKTGMRFLSKQNHHFVSGALPAEVWTISREQWLHRKAFQANQ